MTSEKQKMLSGGLYDPMDPGLVAGRRRARDLCQSLNASPDAAQDERRRILLDLFGRGGDSVWMQPPFFCDYGENIGMAFQIVDDCLDVDATQDEVGKSVGTDVEDGKVTLPVLYAYRNASDAVRGRIRDVYTTPGLKNRVEQLREACDLAGGVDYAHRRAQQLVAGAIERVGALPDSTARRALEGIAGFVLERRW